MTKAIPLRVYRRLLPRNPLGLFYHAVSDELLPHVQHLYPYKSTGQFEADLGYVSAHYRLLSYADFAERSPDTRPGPLRSLVLTFDDGLSECYSVARPLLLRHSTPCMFFVTTDFLDSRRMHYRGKVSLCIDALMRHAPEATVPDALAEMVHESGVRFDGRSFVADWLLSLDQSDEAIIDDACHALSLDIDEYLRSCHPYLTSEEVRSLAADGFTVGGHSCRHPHLGRLTEDEIEEEVVESCKAVMDLTGASQVPFAFPFDSRGVDRAFLDHLIREYPFIWPLFDGGSLKRERDYLVSRVWADRPPSRERSSNVDKTLREAFRNHVVSQVP